MLTIEKNIEIPPIQRPPQFYSYGIPWETMKIGESVFIPTTWRMHEKVRERICRDKLSKGKELGQRFVVRSVDDGVRMWRVPHERAGQEGYDDDY